MRKWVDTRIEWVPFEQGGRKEPVDPHVRYAPLIVFDDVPTTDEVWSVLITIEAYLKPLVALAKLSFLVFDRAPQHLLKKGATFELFEGKNMIATGVIL